MAGYVSRQGTADGLCGIYCLVNFICSRKFPTEFVGQRNALRYLLESAERLQLLRPHKIAEGFEWHELLEIFNDVSSRLFSHYIAVPLHLVDEEIDDDGWSDFFRKVFHERKPGEIALVLNVAGGEHWVLGDSLSEKENGVLVKDSTQKSPRSTVSRPASAEGLLLCRVGDEKFGHLVRRFQGAK